MKRRYNPFNFEIQTFINEKLMIIDETKLEEDDMDESKLGKDELDETKLEKYDLDETKLEKDHITCTFINAGESLLEPFSYGQNLIDGLKHCNANTKTAVENPTINVVKIRNSDYGQTLGTFIDQNELDLPPSNVENGPIDVNNDFLAEECNDFKIVLSDFEKLTDEKHGIFKEQMELFKARVSTLVEYKDFLPLLVEELSRLIDLKQKVQEKSKANCLEREKLRASIQPKNDDKSDVITEKIGKLRKQVFSLKDCFFGSIQNLNTSLKGLNEQQYANFSSIAKTKLTKFEFLEQVTDVQSKVASARETLKNEEDEVGTKLQKEREFWSTKLTDFEARLQDKIQSMENEISRLESLLVAKKAKASSNSRLNNYINLNDTSEFL